ncbi:MAG: LamG-like jellyroll fold domain-containing protein, partial [bacterium]
ATRGRALVGRFYELFCDGGSFYAKDAGQWVGLQVAKSGAFTVEVTLTPAETVPKARGVVFAFDDDKGEDVALLQDKSGLSLRLAGGQPVHLFAPEAGKPVHVLVACGKEKWAAYRDGQPAGTGPLAAGTPPWGARQLVMGASWSGAEPWRGRLEGVALFPRVLTAEEAAGEAAAIKAVQAARKPAKTVRLQGTLVRQAITSSLEQIRPYTRSLTVAEYKVGKVLAGDWKPPTIRVLHWMIMDGKRLPIADRKPGAAVELDVEPLDEHPQLESCRRDEIEDDTDADLFYCESETNP